MKNRKNNNSKKNDLISTILFIAPLLSGLLPLWSNFWVSIVCLIGIVIKIYKNKKIILLKDKKFIFICIYIFSFLFVNFWAVDKGMNIMGFFKNFSIILFILLFIQYNYNDDEKKKVFSVIPYSAVFSLFVSVFLILLGNEAILLNGRLQGVFFYANSYGLFLLIGAIILLMKEKIELKDYIMIATLFLGIIITNSRAIIILTILSLISILIINKKNRKKILIVGISFILTFAGIYSLSQIEKRVDSEMFESSEFLTRLLYYKDGIDMVKENPFGYGYMGWYYKQVEVQTGVYDTKYVHNSVLQVMLDVGIIPTISLISLLLMTFLDKKQSLINRLLLVLILGHSLIDIDLEYMFFILVIGTMINFKTFEMKKNKIQSVICVIGIVMHAVLCFSGICFECDNYKMAYSLIPFYTDALQEELYSTTSEEEQLNLANKIYKLNRNVSGMYEAMSYEEQKNGNYEKALEYEKKRLSLNKYTMANYMHYTEFLSNALQYYNSKKDDEKVMNFVKEICNVENLIKQTLEKTNPLAYKIKHIPNLEMPAEMKAFIEQVKNVV